MTYHVQRISDTDEWHVLDETGRAKCKCGNIEDAHDCAGALNRDDTDLYGEDECQ